MEKRCNKCGNVKPITEFYKCRGMADGHFNQCKSCKKVYADAYQAKHIDELRAKARERMRHPDRVKAATELTKLWAASDDRRKKCHNQVMSALKKGLINREPCVRCGSKESEAHHEDYDKPLDVMWLCRICHKQRHKEIRMELQHE